MRADTHVSISLPAEEPVAIITASQVTICLFIYEKMFGFRFFFFFI